MGKIGRNRAASTTCCPPLPWAKGSVARWAQTASLSPPVVVTVAIATRGDLDLVR